MSYTKKDVPFHVLRKAAWDLFNCWDPTSELLKKCTEGFEPDELDNNGAVYDRPEGDKQNHKPQSISTRVLTRAQKRRQTTEQTVDATIATSDGSTATEHVTGGLSDDTGQSRQQPTNVEERSRHGFRRPKKPRLQEEQNVTAHKAVACAVAEEFSDSPQEVTTASPTDRSDLETSASNNSDDAALEEDSSPSEALVNGSARSRESLNDNDPQQTDEGASTPNPALIGVIAERLLQTDDYEVQIIDAQEFERNVVNVDHASHEGGGYAADARHIDSPRGDLTANEPDPSAYNNPEDKILDEVSQCLESLLDKATPTIDLSPNTVPLQSVEPFSPPSHTSTGPRAEQVQKVHPSHAEEIPHRSLPQIHALPTMGLSTDEPIDDGAEINVLLLERCAEHFSELQRFINELREINIKKSKGRVQRTPLLPRTVDFNGAAAPLLAADDISALNPTSNDTTTEQVLQSDVGDVHLSQGRPCQQAVVTYIHEDGARSSAMQPSETTTDGATTPEGGQALGALDLVARLALDMKHRPFQQNASKEELLRFVLKSRPLAEKYVEVLTVLQKSLEKKAKDAAAGSNNASSD